MSKTPILGIDEVAPSQTGIYATINDALRAWEQADAKNMGILIDTDFSGICTLTELEFTRNRIFIVTEDAAQAYPYEISIPDTILSNTTYRMFAVVNKTSADVFVYAWETPSGSYPISGKEFATVPANTSAILLMDFQDIYMVSGGGGGGGGGIALTDVPYNIHHFVAGVPDDMVFAHVFLEDTEWQDNFAGCIFRALTFGTTYEATSTFDIEVANGAFGFATIGSISVANSTGIGTWSTVGSSSFILAAGDRLKITRNSTKRQLPGDIMISMPGVRV